MAVAHRAPVLVENQAASDGEYDAPFRTRAGRPRRRRRPPREVSLQKTLSGSNESTIMSESLVTTGETFTGLSPSTGFPFAIS